MTSTENDKLQSPELHKHIISFWRGSSAQLWHWPSSASLCWLALCAFKSIPTWIPFTLGLSRYTMNAAWSPRHPLAPAHVPPLIPKHAIQGGGCDPSLIHCDISYQYSSSTSHRHPVSSIACRVSLAPNTVLYHSLFSQGMSHTNNTRQSSVSIESLVPFSWATHSVSSEPTTEDCGRAFTCSPSFCSISVLRKFHFTFTKSKLANSPIPCSARDQISRSQLIECR